MVDKKIFRDPIYNLIIFDKKEDKVILDLIDTFAFQRLKRIRQLGLSWITFPSATHDRFSHSLGVAYLAGMYLDNLRNVPNKIEIIDETGEYEINRKSLKLLLQVAGLLHDIGHGPFSHAFEKITKIKHEQISIKLIKSNEIKFILDSVENDELKGNLSRWVVQILDKSFSVRWAVDVISSQLDVDRMDYLLRDAYFCGVKYVSFDWEWILKNIMVEKIPALGGREGIVVNAAKGVYSLEAFILSRYHMYEQVYFHKTTRGFEQVIAKIMGRVNEFKGDGLKFDNKYYEQFLNDNQDIESFLMLDDFVIISQIGVWAKECDDTILQELCACFIERRPFKMIREVTNDSYLSPDENDKIQRFFINKRLDKKHFVLYDTSKNNPYKDAYLEGESIEKAENIWLMKRDGQVVEFKEVSDMVKGLNLKKTYRVYVHNRFYDEINQILKT